MQPLNSRINIMPTTQTYTRGKRKSAPHQRENKQQQKPVDITRARRGEIRVMVFGGVSEIGKNMYAVEYNNTIILLECGTAFGESATPGIDTIMPNTDYLKERKNHIRGVVVTDSSMTHTGAIPYIIHDIGNPPVYARSATKKIIESRQNMMRNAKTCTVQEVEQPESVRIADDMTLHFFGMTDNAPSVLGVVIETDAGCIAYTGNMQIENKKGVVSAREQERFAPLREKDIILSLAGSVNAERHGFSLHDQQVAKVVIQMIQESPHRAILPLFPSQIKRNSAVLEGVLKMGRKIYIQGAHLFAVLQIACESGMLNVPKEALIPIEEIGHDDTDNSVIFTAGAENEEYEVLEKISQNDYRYTAIKKEDTVIFPAPFIQTNARSVQNLKDRLSRLGAIIRSYDTSDVKSSKHPYKDELRWVHQNSNPKYFIPVQGYHYMLTAHTHILRDIGMSPDSCVIPNNGSIIDISPDGKVIKRQKQKLTTTGISVDGHTPTLIQNVVIQDRKTLGQEGILILVIFIDQKKLILKKSPDVLSRGFIYLKESRILINRTRIVIKKTVEKTLQDQGKLDIDTVKKAVQKDTQSFLMNETNKRPIIIPVLFT